MNDHGVQGKKPDAGTKFKNRGSNSSLLDAAESGYIRERGGFRGWLRGHSPAEVPDGMRTARARFSVSMLRFSAVYSEKEGGGGWSGE